MNKARASGGQKRLAFAEGEEQKVIRAAYQIQDEKIGIPVLIGRKRVIEEQLKFLSLDYKPEIVDPNDFKNISKYEAAYYELRNRKGLTMVDAVKKVREPNIFGSLMVKMNDADAFISGLTYDYPDVIRPALQIHHTQKDVIRAAGVYLMIV
jgi:malate dehydrogenase (oxaloacetate-decarboxylating)(NADP+)